jgi:hypothetical protein
MEIAGRIAKIIRDEKPAKVCLDTGGLGVGIYDRLVEHGHGEGRRHSSPSQAGGTVMVDLDLHDNVNEPRTCTNSHEPARTRTNSHEPARNWSQLVATGRN